LNLIDIIIILIVAVGFILGFKDGFVRKIIGLIGIIIAIYLALKFSGELGVMIENAFDVEYYLAEIVAGTAIFLVIIIIFSILKRLVHPFDKVNNTINQVLGGIVGALQIILFLSAAFFLLNIFNIPEENEKQNSLLYFKVYNFLPAAVDLVYDYSPSTKSIFEDYFRDKDTLQ
jgi:membrane protein required for colicin V production